MSRDSDRFHYFRDHDASGAFGARWGVRDSETARAVAREMDKTDAQVLALFLSGCDAEAIAARESFAAIWAETEAATVGAR